MKALLGKPVAEKLLSVAKRRIETSGITPGLAVILIGDDPASHIYVGLKEKAAESIGMHFEKHVFGAEAKQEEVESLLDELNTKDSIHGIIIQLPLPKGWDTDALIARIDPKKDADGFHPETVAKLLAGKEVVPPVFPGSVLALLQETREVLNNKKAVIFARSLLFGQVLSRVLESQGLSASVELQEESEHGTTADVVILAVGKPGFFTASMARHDAIIIDGGITRVDGRVHGDADPASLSEHAGWLTPVPGGVGPVTVASLIERVTRLAVLD